MKKLAKTVNLKAVPGSTEASVISKLCEVEQEGRGQQMRYMKQWLQGGYLLGELGHGLLESLIAMDGAKLLDDLSPKQKADFLVNMIQRTAWREPVAAKQVPVPEEAKTPDPEVSQQPEEVEVVHKEEPDNPESKQEKPVKKGRRKLNFQVG